MPISKCSQCNHSSATTIHLSLCTLCCVSLYVTHEPAVGCFKWVDPPVVLASSPSLASREFLSYMFRRDKPQKYGPKPLAPWPLPVSVGEAPLLCNGVWWGDNGLHTLLDHRVKVPMIEVLLAPFLPQAACSSYHMDMVFLFEIKTSPTLKPYHLSLIFLFTNEVCSFDQCQKPIFCWFWSWM